MLLFGLIGYFMRKTGFPLAPHGSCQCVTRRLETSLQQKLLISQGSPWIFFTRPISAVFMGLAIISIVQGLWLQIQTKAPERALEEDEE